MDIVEHLDIGVGVIVMEVTRPSGRELERTPTQGAFCQQIRSLKASNAQPKPLRRCKEMKKAIWMVALAAMLMVGSVVAGGYMPFTPTTSAKTSSPVFIGQAQKDPADWSVIKMAGHLQVAYDTKTSYTFDGGFKRVTTHPDVLSVAVYPMGLERFQQYTVIYYGDEANNDVWPYATCIHSFRTSFAGNYIGSAVRPGTELFYDFLHDSVAQKLWIVKSSDVDCNAGKMTAWNPDSYLFEQEALPLFAGTI
jgi:hypothetical protein